MNNSLKDILKKNDFVIRDEYLNIVVNKYMEDSEIYIESNTQLKTDEYDIKSYSLPKDFEVIIDDCGYITIQTSLDWYSATDTQVYEEMQRTSNVVKDFIKNVKRKDKNEKSRNNC